MYDYDGPITQEEIEERMRQRQNQQADVTRDQQVDRLIDAQLHLQNMGKLESEGIMEAAKELGLSEQEVNEILNDPAYHEAGAEYRKRASGNYVKQLARMKGLGKHKDEPQNKADSGDYGEQLVKTVEKAKETKTIGTDGFADDLLKSVLPDDDPLLQYSVQAAPDPRAARGRGKGRRK